VTVISKDQGAAVRRTRIFGAQVYQYDIWRSPFSNIQQTSGKNQGVMWGYMTRS